MLLRVQGLDAAAQSDLIRSIYVQCESALLEVRPGSCGWLRGYSQEATIALPIAHGEGRYQVEPSTLHRLEDRGQVVLRYRHNPNGSVGDVAGLCNEGGNVLGLMPHPERACDPALGGVDGRALLASLGCG